MYGIGYISRSLVDTLQAGNGLGKLPPMRSAVGNAFVIDYVPLTDIYTDEKNFQNRGDRYSEKSVRSIVDAVANGNFNWFAFDPVILWENPADGKKYVLSGHSRTQAFRQISKQHPDWLVDGLSFDYIPARIYRGTFDDAKRLALNSNTLATPETLTERAAYYRSIRNRQGITKGKDLKALKERALRENNGQMIWDLSYLPENGISFDSLKAFKLGEQSGSTENFLRLATICQWIGKAFQIYKGLSTAHDRELFNFLMTGGYGSKSGQYFNFTSLNDRLQKLYAKNVANDKKTNTNGEYTEPFQIAAYKKDDATLDTLDNLKKDAAEAYKQLKSKLKELRENNATREQIFQVATPYFNGWANALYDWWSLLDRTPKTDNAPGLFGIPTLAEIVDGLGKIEPISPSYSAFRKDAEAVLDNLYSLDADADYNVQITTGKGRHFSEKINTLNAALDYAYKWANMTGDSFFIFDKYKELVLMRSYDWNGNPYFATEWDYQDHFPKDFDYQNKERFVIKKRRLPKGEPFMSNKQAAAKKAYDAAHNMPKFKASDVFDIHDTDSPRMRLAAERVAESLAPDELSKATVENKLYDFIFTRKLPNYNEAIDDPILESLFDRIIDGLGKPTLKFEFEDNAELLNFQKQLHYIPFDHEPMSYNSQTQEFEPLNGMTVNDKPAAVFNCPESELDCQGFKPTYRRLSDYSHLIDAADGAKTLKGYGFEKSTLEELVNACRQYKQVERLAAHLKDPDKLQSAFNIWHWLHTNVRYNYDTPGQEEIRTPARTWADRERGVDCDCLAVFTACLLINMGYKPAFEIVAFNDSPTYSHIYVNLDGVAIDRVLPIFMARPQNITKTKIMEIPVYQLSGIGGCNLGQISRLRMQDFLDSDTARWYYDDAIVGMLLDDINRMIRSGLIKTKKDIVSYMRRSSDKLSANGYSDAAEKYHVLSDRINPNINSIIKGMQVYDGLSGVYSSTLAKIQSGTATGNDLNDFRKTQVLVTLKGIDEDAYKLAALLMPHIATVGDDGKYYFDNAKFAEIATKADAGLSLLKQQGASKEVLQNWLAEVVSDIDIADTTATATDEDTIVVVINPKGCPCRVAGNFTATELQTLSPMAQTATAQDTAAAATPSPVYATTPYPTVQPEEEKSNTKWWILGGIAAAFGLAAISKKKNGRR